jgi:hypothetical protein
MDISVSWIAVVLAVVPLVAAVISLVQRALRGPHETALLRAAQAAAGQRRLVAAQHVPQAQAAATQLVSSATQRQDLRGVHSSIKPGLPRFDLNAYWTRYLKVQYEDTLVAPLPPRLATLISQLEAQA